jgi:hypothetical protein
MLGSTCLWNHRVFVLLIPPREDRAGGEDRQAAGGAHRLVCLARAKSFTDRTRSWTVVAMALCGDEGGGVHFVAFACLLLRRAADIMQCA